MPIYEYTCDDCRSDFELLVLGQQAPQCPSCEGSSLTRRLSVISTPASGKPDSGPVCDPLPGGG